MYFGRSIVAVSVRVSGIFGKNFRVVTDISYKYCVFRFEYHFGFGYFNTSIGCFGESFRLVSFISYEYCVFLIGVSYRFRIFRYW